MVVEDLIRTVMESIREIAKTETVVGDPVTIANTVIIPVSKISFGFGAGGGGSGREESGKGGKGEGGGTGGGVTIEPVAFVVVSDGKAQLLPLKEKENTFGKVIDLMPEIVTRIKDLIQKGKKEED